MNSKILAAALTVLAFAIPTTGQSSAYGQTTTMQGGPRVANMVQHVLNKQPYGQENTTQGGPLVANMQPVGGPRVANMVGHVYIPNAYKHPYGPATGGPAGYTGPNQTTQYQGYQGQILGQQIAGGQSQISGSGFKDSFRRVYP